MTFEHKIIVGLDDIKAVIIECKCGTRVSLSPDAVHIPEKCPATACDAVWVKGSLTAFRASTMNGPHLISISCRRSDR